jgi:hypothetical protein
MRARGGIIAPEAVRFGAGKAQERGAVKRSRLRRGIAITFEREQQYDEALLHCAATEAELGETPAEA